MQVNSLVLEELPWGGYYFGGIDTKLKAIETDLNYEFDKWILNNNTVLPNDTLTEVIVELTTGDNIIAQFKPKEFSDSLVINEINYNSSPDADAADWVEFYNPHEYYLDLEGWIFRDSDDLHTFVFPAGTIIPPFDYLVLCRDSVDFNTVFPDVENYIGEMGFGLSSNGELIRIFDAEGALVDTVHYEVEDPWPTEPNGNGPTLELKFWSYDNALPESWIASALNGTPGEMNGYVVNIPEPEEKVPFTFTIYPNPFKNQAIFQVTSKTEMENYEVVFYNLYGKEVQRIKNVNGNRFEIQRDKLKAGMYICNVLDQHMNIVGISRIIIN